MVSYPGGHPSVKSAQDQVDDVVVTQHNRGQPNSQAVAHHQPAAPVAEPQHQEKENRVSAVKRRHGGDRLGLEAHRVLRTKGVGKNDGFVSNSFGGD
jgi:hypothetical protein